jgi:hypothetical protein
LELVLTILVFTTLQEFFLTAKHILRSTPSHGTAAFQKWNEPEVLLNNQLSQCKDEVHKAFCGKGTFIDDVT